MHTTYLDAKYFKEFIDSSVTDIHILIAKWKTLFALAIGSISWTRLDKGICLHKNYKVELFRYEDQPPLVVEPTPVIGKIYYINQW